MTIAKFEVTFGQSGFPMTMVYGLLYAGRYQRTKICVACNRLPFNQYSEVSHSDPMYYGHLAPLTEQIWGVIDNYEVESRCRRHLMDQCYPACCFEAHWILEQCRDWDMTLADYNMDIDTDIPEVSLKGILSA